MSRGHTLLEMLIALGAAAIIAGIAAPGFASLLLDSRRDAAVQALIHGAHAARRLAAARGEVISLCGAAVDERCTGGRDWPAGLLLAGADGSLLRSIGPWPGGITVTANRSRFDFQPSARHATTGTVTVCDQRAAAAARAVIISRSGRPRVDVRDGSGQPLSC